MAAGLFLGAQMTVRWRKSLSRPTRVLCQNSRFVGTCPLASLVSQRRRLPPSGTRPCGAAHVGCLLHGGDGWRARGGGGGLDALDPQHRRGHSGAFNAGGDFLERDVASQMGRAVLGFDVNADGRKTAVAGVPGRSSGMYFEASRMSSQTSCAVSTRGFCGSITPIKHTCGTPLAYLRLCSPVS